MEVKKKAARPRGTDSARVMQVIETQALEGAGTEEDPSRIQRRYWSLEGELLAVGAEDAEAQYKALQEQYEKLKNLHEAVAEGWDK